MLELISVMKIEHDRLIRDSEFLECLRAAGVDNWEGYSMAVRLFNETHPEEEDDD